MNQVELNSLWQSCLLHIKNILMNDVQFNTWFMPIKLLSYQDGVALLAMPSDFFREIIETRYSDMIKKVLAKVMGLEFKSVKLEFQIEPVLGQAPIRVSESASKEPQTKCLKINGYVQAENKAIVYQTTKRQRFSPRLNSVFCFENLVKGDCNKLGLVTAHDISKAPGETSYNPLFLYGGPGLGKTHIAQAIGLSIYQNIEDKIVLYVTANEFKTQYMDAAGVRNKLTDFLAFYCKIDVLIVDDIQDLVGSGSQNALFNVFNYLHDNKKQLIFASDRPPVELSQFEDRLLSRFKWGGTVELKAPDYETRLEVLKQRCKREGCEIDLKILEYVARNVKSNFRELEGVLISLIAHATDKHSKITIELAESVMKGIVSMPEQELTLELILSTVCDYFKLSSDQFLSKTRKRDVVQARQIAMYLCRHYMNCPLNTIGSVMGGKDHSTVIHAYNTVSDLLSVDKNIKQYVCDIESILKLQ